MNLFLDAPIAQRRAGIDKLKSQVGACSAASPVIPENWMRGQFNLTCANGAVGVFFTLAPTQPPTVQHVEFRKLESPQFRMVAPTGPPAGVSCAQ
jgi:serine-type D-Ala-D-Ala carboxypeptidase/endopeptidase